MNANRQLEHRCSGEKTGKPNKKPRKRIRDVLKEGIAYTVAGTGVLVFAAFLGSIGTALVECNTYRMKNAYRDTKIETTVFANKNVTDKEIMKALSDLCYGEENAKDLLTKIHKIDEVFGNHLKSMTYKKEAPGGGLLPLLVSYCAQKPSRKYLYIYADFGYPLTAGSYEHQHIVFGHKIDKIAELYRAGKLDSLIEKAEKGQL